ncbi:DUF4097 family beta strand repeat-containing protein [Georgenia sp. Z1344]|uniref:DUF4097 family beta strand repeat-containing protein n=1 Tax=Georgenia sp. Z1344 TaxID=3416706 RepID=UPI003CEEE748
MSTDDTTRELPTTRTDDPGRPGRPGEPTRAGRPGRTILVGISALLVGASAVGPAFGYVQGRDDGQPIDESGTTAATSFAIDADRADVTIVRTDGDEIEWSVTGGRATTRVELTEDGDTARLEVDDAREIWLDVGPSFDVSWMGSAVTPTARVTLAVPEGTDIDVANDFGQLEAEDVALGDLGVSASFGSVRVSGSAENLDLELDYGDATATDLAVTGTIEIYSDFGDVELRSPEVPAAVDVESSFGDVTVALPPANYSVSHTSDLGEASDRLEKNGDGDPVPVRLHTSFGAVTAETY